MSNSSAGWQHSQRALLPVMRSLPSSSIPTTLPHFTPRLHLHRAKILYKPARRSGGARSRVAPSSNTAQSHCKMPAQRRAACLQNQVGLAEEELCWGEVQCPKKDKAKGGRESSCASLCVCLVGSWGDCQDQSQPLGKIKPDREVSEGQRHTISQGLLSLHHSWIQSAQDLKGSTCPLP